MNESIPDIIKEVGFGFDWSEEKVWGLDVPVTRMPIEKLSWHLEVPFWDENGTYNLKPSDVMAHPEAHPKEYERTMAADTTHPIDIMENKGRWLILDGLHRLVKQAMEGATEVDVRIIPRERIPDITL